MPLVRPFRGLSYRAVGAVADLSDLVCPPYDVISPGQQATLLARDPHNAVRLELSAEADPHAGAAATLATWLADGTLERRAEPALYAYSHARAGHPDRPSVHGVLARVLLEPFGGEVRAHEQTMAGPKADRLALLRATRTQFSPILAAYFTTSADYPDPANLPWTSEWHARDGDGLLHRLRTVEPTDQLLTYLGQQRLYIADGHHRYETALAYWTEVRGAPGMADAPPGSLASDWMMMVLVNAEREQLEIRATHRLVLRAVPEALEALARDASPLWQALPVAPAQLPQRLAELRDAPDPVFGLVLPFDQGYLLMGDGDALAARMALEPMHDQLRRLDLSILHAAILADRLGIDAASVAAGGRLAYTRSEAEAIRAVADGAAQAAILVRPTRLEQLAAVAGIGEVMPQKSTYFYPKLLTGLVFNPLQD
jgi:uncharacterized protein (DUF1015 family)